MTTRRKGKYRLKSLRVRECSFVDQPAVPSAVFCIAKRSDVPGEALTPEQDRTLDLIMARLQKGDDATLTPEQLRSLEKIRARLAPPLTPEEERRLEIIRARVDRLFPPAPARHSRARVIPSAEAARIFAFMGGV